MTDTSLHRDVKLSERAQPFLAEFLEIVTSNGTLTTQTLPRFVEMVEAYAEIRETGATLQREGEFTTRTTKRGVTWPRAHPALRIYNRASWRFMQLVGVFQMTPASRAKAALRARPKGRP
jgi:phage terminase small subunit